MFFFLWVVIFCFCNISSNYHQKAEDQLLHLPFSCHSPVGHHRGRGLVSLGHGCERKGTAMHEFLHVLGFWHEQNRYDRDKYVTINLSNVKTST